MELNEKEAHCVARLLQGALFGDTLFDGCIFCKFKCSVDNDPAPHLDNIRKKFMDSTQVDLGYTHYKDFVKSDFPYKRFLKHSNDDIKQNIREYFKSFGDI